jgi:hypothetical protein
VTDRESVLFREFNAASAQASAVRTYLFTIPSSYIY